MSWCMYVLCIEYHVLCNFIVLEINLIQVMLSMRFSFVDGRMVSYCGRCLTLVSITYPYSDVRPD